MAGKEADSLIARLKATPPVDPIEIARTEYPLLRTGGSDLGSRYDGKLEYVPSKRVFLLFFNTKYNSGLPKNEHHPRTRFSVSHELGHFFLEHHHQRLRRGAKSHRSISEFRSLRQVEREADSFAANLLLPTAFVKPLVSKAELSLSRIDHIARHFSVSTVSAAIRSVQLSDFPCAVAGIREGAVVWMFPSQPLIDAGIYPKRGLLPPNAAIPWNNMQNGLTDRTEAEGTVRHWFQTFERDDLSSIYLTEEYHPIPVMETLLVLLTVNEEDLAEDEDAYDDDD